MLIINIMKAPKVIKIIKSEPTHNQDGIEEYIGKTFDVVNFNKEDNSVSCRFGKTEGLYVINRSEYEVVL